MKRDKIIYWTTTGLLAVGMGMSAFMYLSNNPAMMSNFQTLGIPAYLVKVLGVAKLLGAIALLAPVKSRLKEWAYAGFTFTFLGAVWTHFATDTSWGAPMIALAILTVSYMFWLRVNNSNEKLSRISSERNEVQLI